MTLYFRFTLNLVSDDSVVFEGYASASAGFDGIYETINGTTNFSNNLLSNYQMLSFVLNTMSHYPSYTNLLISATENVESNRGIITATNDSGSLTENIYITLIPTADPQTPISNVCFPKNTLITTDQGNVMIEDIDTSIHTIDNKPIVAITKTASQYNYLIEFDKDSLGMNCPSEKTVVSRNHKIQYKGQMIPAHKFLGRFEGINKVEYDGEPLYNILMERHETFTVNNMRCESLHPENIIAKIYKSSQDQHGKLKCIVLLNKSITEKQKVSSQLKMKKQLNVKTMSRLTYY